MGFCYDTLGKFINLLTYYHNFKLKLIFFKSSLTHAKAPQSHSVKQGSEFVEGS